MGNRQENAVPANSSSFQRLAASLGDAITRRIENHRMKSSILHQLGKLTAAPLHNLRLSSDVVLSNSCEFRRAVMGRERTYVINRFEVEAVLAFCEIDKRPFGGGEIASGRIEFKSSGSQQEASAVLHLDFCDNVRGENAPTHIVDLYFFQTACGQTNSAPIVSPPDVNSPRVRSRRENEQKNAVKHSSHGAIVYD